MQSFTSVTLRKLSFAAIASENGIKTLQITAANAKGPTLTMKFLKTPSLFEILPDLMNVIAKNSEYEVGGE